MITEEQQGPLFWRFVLCSFFLKPGHKQDHFGGKPLRRHTEDPDQCCIKEGRRGLGCGRVGRPGEDNRRQGELMWNQTIYCFLAAGRGKGKPRIKPLRMTPGSGRDCPALTLGLKAAILSWLGLGPRNVERKRKPVIFLATFCYNSWMNKSPFSHKNPKAMTKKALQ